MSEREFGLQLGIKAVGEFPQIEQLFNPEIKALPGMKLKLGFIFGTEVTPEVLQTVSDHLGIEVYKPEPETSEAQEYVGGYHLTYVDPVGKAVHRVGIVARRSFTGHMFHGGLNDTGFQNYPEENDLLSGTVTEAARIPGSDNKYQVKVYHQHGILLPFQFAGRYPIADNVERQLQQIVGELDRDAQSQLAWSRAPFTIREPQYTDRVGINIDLDRECKVADVEVILPGASALFSLINLYNETAVIKDRAIKLSGKSNKDSRSMKNFKVGGWPPCEPSFMQDRE